jgi:hypothetical protein
MSLVGQNQKKLDPSICFPLRPRKRILRHAVGISLSCQNQTWLLLPIGLIFCE